MVLRNRYYEGSPHPDVSGVVHVDRHVGGIDAFHAADGDALGLVLVLVSGLPEGLGGAVCQAADHGWTARRLDVRHAGQVLQTEYQAHHQFTHTDTHTERTGKTLYSKDETTEH